jgi:intracellular sulfur oxidation DsrE/DsrF family protein
MNTRAEFSDELLGSYLDGELLPSERHAIQSRALTDEQLRRELCELNTVKQLVRDAYASEPAGAGAQRGGVRRAGLLATSWAAAIALGWTAHLWVGADKDVAAAAITAAAPASTPQALVVGADGPSAAQLAAATQNGHVVVHVGTRDPVAIQAALRTASALLATRRADASALEVEIVANSSGLDLLRVGVSGFQEDLAALRKQYPQLRLIACNQSIDRVRERGEEVVLAPGVIVAPSALDEVVARLHAGWIYLRT